MAALEENASRHCEAVIREGCSEDLSATRGMSAPRVHLDKPTAEFSISLTTMGGETMLLEHMQPLSTLHSLELAAHKLLGAPEGTYVALYSQVAEGPELLGMEDGGEQTLAELGLADGAQLTCILQVIPWKVVPESAQDVQVRGSEVEVIQISQGYVTVVATKACNQFKIRVENPKYWFGLGVCTSSSSNYNTFCWNTNAFKNCALISGATGAGAYEGKPYVGWDSMSGVSGKLGMFQSEDEVLFELDTSTNELKATGPRGQVAGTLRASDEAYVPCICVSDGAAGMKFILMTE